MGNLYEQTQTLHYIKDMILLEPDNHPNKDLPLKDKLQKHQKDFSNIDNPETAFWQINDSQKRKKQES
jgi:hypothetical protein